MNHSLVFNGASRDGDSNNYWEAAIAFATHLGTFLQALVIPLLLVIGVQFAVQLYNTIRREALRQLQQHVDALYQDRQRLIEEIKLDLLRTLNKGTKEPDAASDASSFVVAAKISEKKECEKPAVEKRLTSTPLRANSDGTTGRSNQNTVERRPAAAPSSSSSNEWATRRLDRKECSNIVNEIIYQIQSGTRNAEDGIRPAKTGAVLEGDNRGETRGGNAEDSAVLRDVHRRNVVARMKTLFEQPTVERPKTSVKLRSSVTPDKQPPKEVTLRHFSSVVNILRRNEPTSYPSRTISASLENLRPSGGGQFHKASSEPPTVIRLRRRIRSQHSLSESVEDILETERFSKRLSQYSISDLLDEEEDDSRKRNSADRYSGEVKAGVPYDRVSRGLKTLSTFSLSELLQDEEMVDGTEETEVVLRRSKPTSTPPAAYRNAVDNIEQILIAENLSKDYWKYSISNLLDCMEEEDEERRTPFKVAP